MDQYRIIYFSKSLGFASLAIVAAYLNFSAAQAMKCPTNEEEAPSRKHGLDTPSTSEAKRQKATITHWYPSQSESMNDRKKGKFTLNHPVVKYASTPSLDLPRDSRPHTHETCEETQKQTMKVSKNSWFTRQGYKDYQDYLAHQTKLSVENPEKLNFLFSECIEHLHAGSPIHSVAFSLGNFEILFSLSNDSFMNFKGTKIELIQQFPETTRESINKAFSFLIMYYYVYHDSFSCFEAQVLEFVVKTRLAPFPVQLHEYFNSLDEKNSLNKNQVGVIGQNIRNYMNTIISLQPPQVIPDVEETQPLPGFKDLLETISATTPRKASPIPINANWYPSLPKFTYERSAEQYPQNIYTLSINLVY